MDNELHYFLHTFLISSQTCFVRPWTRFVPWAPRLSRRRKLTLSPTLSWSRFATLLISKSKLIYQLQPSPINFLELPVDLLTLLLISRNLLMNNWTVLLTNSSLLTLMLFPSWTYNSKSPRLRVLLQLVWRVKTWMSWLPV